MESTSSNLKRMHREEGREAKCPKRTKQLSKFEQIKQKYNFEAALADLIDNSLQASWSDHNNFRQISIDINKDIISIFHNGTSIDSSQETSIVQWGLSASREQELNQQSVGDSDLYLTPLFGKFGYGVAVSSMHLGRRARICSNTKASGEICIIDIESDGSLQDSSGALIKMTEGGMPSTSEEDLIESFRGRFTKVQIFDLHMGGVGLHKLLCRLKDIYFPYIQIDKTCALRVKPVEFQVNGQNLAYIDGGKVSITNLHACSGPEFKLQLCLSSIPEVAGSPSCTSRKGNARMTFVYFPIIQGEENTDRIIKELDVSGYGIEGFSCVSVRRLGRLLPNACWALLPFMEPKLKTGDEAYRLKRCYSRVKCFIETDGGFFPTQCKTDLMHEDPYTNALKSFGAQLPRDHQGLHVQILKEENIWSLPQLERLYKDWILNMHTKFDEEVVCNDQETVMANVNPSNKWLLGITPHVVRVCKKVSRKGKLWQSGQKIKIWKGASAKFQKTNTYATIDYILVEGFPGSTGGESYFICRRIDTEHDMGCQVIKNSNEEYIIINIRQAVILPLRAIDSGKVEEVDSFRWNKKISKHLEDQPRHVISGVRDSPPNMMNVSFLREETPSNNGLQTQNKETYLWEENQRLKSRNKNLRGKLAKSQQEYDELCPKEITLVLEELEKLKNVKKKILKQ
ncbi:structural maintenance of chromosomes flexible hinge domain-containing protein GMI1-like, partial [Apium graveolens]|uniref:structural maintenance of chromosomes flexible hinge domain-containing protein GMI1-like n=1 Tax=Apium graveolens TaxID=4045 RepID=UPI003D7949B3